MKILPIRNICTYKTLNSDFKKQELHFASNSLQKDCFERQKTTFENEIIKNTPRDYRDKFIEIITPYKDLTQNSDVNLFENCYEQNHIYSIPLKYAIMVSNSLAKSNDAHIYQSSPKVFEGLEKKEIYNILDTFARLENKKEKQTINAGSKELEFKFEGSGKYGNAYLIKDKDENCAIIKIYKDKYELMDNRGFLSEIPVLNELTKRKTNNTPELYMANAGYFRYNRGKIEKDVPWILEEYITRNTPPKKSPNTLSDFFRKTNMTHYDWYENVIGDYFIDMGGVLPNDFYDYLETHNNAETADIKKFEKNFSSVIELLKKGISIEKILEMLS